MKNAHHLKSLGLYVEPGAVSFDRQQVADHASNLAAKQRKNLEVSPPRMRTLHADMRIYII